MTLGSYNQLLEELIKLFPEDTDNITSILIMEDDIKLQSIVFLNYWRIMNYLNFFRKEK